MTKYPNDFHLNKILADIYYSQCFSANMEHIDDKKERGIYFYERCIELYDPKQAADVTEESLYIQIATLCMWDQGQVERAMEIRLIILAVPWNYLKINRSRIYTKSWIPNVLAE